MAAGNHQFALTRKYLENIRRHTTAEELFSNMLHTGFSDINLTPPLKKKGKTTRKKTNNEILQYSHCSTVKSVILSSVPLQKNLTNKARNLQESIDHSGSHIP